MGAAKDISEIPGVNVLEAQTRAVETLIDLAGNAKSELVRLRAAEFLLFRSGESIYDPLYDTEDE